MFVAHGRIVCTVIVAYTLHGWMGQERRFETTRFSVCMTMLHCFTVCRSRGPGPTIRMYYIRFVCVRKIWFAGRILCIQNFSLYFSMSYARNNERFVRVGCRSRTAGRIPHWRTLATAQCHVCSWVEYCTCISNDVWINNKMRLICSRYRPHDLIRLGAVSRRTAPLVRYLCSIGWAHYALTHSLTSLFGWNIAKQIDFASRNCCRLRQTPSTTFWTFRARWKFAKHLHMSTHTCGVRSADTLFAYSGIRHPRAFRTAIPNPSSKRRQRERRKKWDTRTQSSDGRYICFWRSHSPQNICTHITTMWKLCTEPVGRPSAAKFPVANVYRRTVFGGGSGDDDSIKLFRMDQLSVVRCGIGIASGDLGKCGNCRNKQKFENLYQEPQMEIMKLDWWIWKIRDSNENSMRTTFCRGSPLFSESWSACSGGGSSHNQYWYWRNYCAMENEVANGRWFRAYEARWPFVWLIGMVLDFAFSVRRRY